MIWLASRRTAIFQGADATEGFIVAMLRSLCLFLTLLCSEATKYSGLASCEHLLWEDLEVRGVRPLEFDQVPEACRCFCDETGKVKPRPDNEKTTPTDGSASLARMLDVLRVAYYLAEDSVVPLACSVEHEALVFQYQQVQSVVALQEDRAIPEAEMRSAADTDTSNRKPETNTGRPGTQPTGVHTTDIAQSNSIWPGIPPGDEATNECTENTVMSMVSPFLRPPTPQSAAAVSAQSESSYGWHSATAEEVFADMQAKRSPGGTVRPTTFEQLPWKWLHTPTPQKGDKEARDIFSTDSGDGDDGPGIRSLKGPIETDLQSPLGRRAISAMQRSRPPSSLRSPISPVVDEAHRNQLLQSFTGGSSAPRTSSFSHWSPDHATANVRQASGTSPWGPATSAAAPASSFASAFSHPSSLYQGTPTGSMAGNMMPSHVPDAFTRDWPPRQGTSWQKSATSDRQLQVDSTTSSYDAAIFDGVLKDWK